jgi:hypothetical protein
MTLFADSRLSGFCIYCGAPPDSWDHVPSKVLLDRPYPENLPVVESCRPCNTGFSLDEEYFACFVDCVLSGSTEDDKLRETTRRILARKPALRRRIEDSRVATDSGVSFAPEGRRVENVLTKLARGIAAYELSEPQFHQPTRVSFAPLATLPPETLEAFESVNAESPEDAITAWPEIGSRAFQRAAFLYSGLDIQVVPDVWLDVQEGNFRYFASGGAEVSIRMVIREYLAAEVSWSL